jgi:hypothetical protein
MLSMVKMDENGNTPKEELIAFYHSEFVKALKTFGYLEPTPSLTDLNIELIKHGHISVLLGICFTGFNFLDPTTMKIEDLFEAHSEKSLKIRRQMYNHPMCKAILQRDLKSWLYKGWLDN